MNEVDCSSGVHDLVARVHFRNEENQNFLARRKTVSESGSKGKKMGARLSMREGGR